MTQDVASRVADDSTMEEYQSKLIGGGTAGSSNNEWGSRYAGRVWSDKSVFTAPLTGDDTTSVKLTVEDDGVAGTVTSDEDFLTVFSALGSSQVKSETTPVNLVLALDISGSMGSPNQYEPNGFVNLSSAPVIATSDPAGQGNPLGGVQIPPSQPYYAPGTSSNPTTINSSYYGIGMYVYSRSATNGATKDGKATNATATWDGATLGNGSLVTGEIDDNGIPDSLLATTFVGNENWNPGIIQVSNDDVTAYNNYLAFCNAFVNTIKSDGPVTNGNLTQITEAINTAIAETYQATGTVADYIDTVTATNLTRLYSLYTQNEDAIRTEPQSWPNEVWESWSGWKGQNTSNVFQTHQNPIMNIYNAPNRLYNVIGAANNLIDSFMKLNGENQVSVVAYDSTAYVLLPMGHYTSCELSAQKHHWQGSWPQWGSQVSVEYTTESQPDPVSKTVTSWSNTDTDTALYASLDELMQQETTTYDSPGGTVSRLPVVILLTDGAANTLPIDTKTPGSSESALNVAWGGNVSRMSGIAGDTFQLNNSDGVTLKDGAYVQIAAVSPLAEVLPTAMTCSTAYAPEGGTSGIAADAVATTTPKNHIYVNSAITKLTLVSTIMNTAAQKSAVSQYYTNNLKQATNNQTVEPVEPVIYTIGYDLAAYQAGTSQATAVEAVLNPSNIFNETTVQNGNADQVLTQGWDAYSKWSTATNGTPVDLDDEKSYVNKHTISASLVGAGPATYTGADNKPITVTKDQVKANIGYNKQYFTASSSGAGPSINEIFSDLLDQIVGTAFSPIGGANAAGVDDALTYVDPIGTYMEVKNPYTSMSDPDATSDMNIALFGNLYGVVRAAVYDYQWSYAYSQASGEQFGALPEGWYKGDGADAMYAGADGKLPIGITSSQEAWAAGWTYRINYKTIQNFVPNLKNTSDPSSLGEKQQNTVYTVYRIATDQNGETVDDAARGLWRLNPAYASSASVAYDPNTYILSDQNSVNEQNPPLGVYRLSDIRTWVEDTGDWNDMNLDDLVNSTDYDQALFVNIPANALPMQLVTITESYDKGTSSATTTYKTNLGGDNGGQASYYAQSTPFRLFYSVGVADSVLGEDGGVDVALLDYDYLSTHKTPQSNVYFNSNFYSEANYINGTDETSATVGDSVVTFSPGSDNRFYAFQRNLQLYQILDDDDYKLENRPEEVPLANPEDRTSSSLTLKGVTYPAVTQVTGEPSQDQGVLTSDGWYYIVIDYYEFGKDGTATPVHLAIGRQGKEFGSGLASGDIAAGSYLSWVDTEGVKEAIPYNANDPNGGKPSPSDGTNWAIATSVGGLRVGAMTMSVEPKEEDANKTGTASTVYAPLVSSATPGEEAGDAILNVDLGNNGRLEVADQLLLVTKQLNPMGFAPDQTFQMTAAIEGFTGQKDAVVVNWDAESQNWVRRIATIDVLTNNNGLLQAKDGTLLQTNASGGVVSDASGQTYNVFVGENEAGGSHTFRIYQAADDPNYTPGEDGTEGGRTIYVNSLNGYQNTDEVHYQLANAQHPAGSMEFWADEVWLIPTSLEYSEDSGGAGDWWIVDGVPQTSDPDAIITIPENGNEEDGHQHFVFATRIVTDESGMGSALEINSDVMLRSQYMTQSVDFGTDGTADFTLADGKGLVFDGIDDGSAYTVSETLSQANIAAQCDFQSVRHVLNNGNITYGPNGQVIGTEGSIALNGTSFSHDATTYTVTGDTGVEEEAVQFTNGPSATPPPPSGGPHKEELTPGDGQLVGVGEEITYRISYVNNTTDTANVTIVDPLDAGVDYVKSQPMGSYNPTGTLPAGCAVDYVYQGIVTWTIPDVPAGGSGSVLLTVRVNGGAHAVDLVRDQAFVQVGNGAWQPTEEPENPLGGPTKAEVAPGPGLLVKSGETITYDITYENKGSQPADITIVDPLHVGVDFVSASDGGVYDPNGTAPGTMTVPYDYHGTVTWTLEQVPPGTVGFVTLTVRLNSQGESMDTIYNQAFIEVDDGPWEPSDEPENPIEDGEPHKVEIYPGEKVPVEVGENVTYRIDYDNPTDATQTITIVDPIHVGATFLFASDGGTYSPTGSLPAGSAVNYPWSGTVTWTIPDVPAGGTGYVILVVQVDSDALQDGEIWDQAFVQVGNGAWQPTEMPMNPVVETPSTPTYPSGTPSNPSTGLPKTGDDRPLLLPMALTILGVTCVALGAWLLLRRRRT